jgi:catechol 2,3-dioxygenase-like lactoylglutathione lyase family enzyme
VQPPLEGWPHLREISQVFNATQIVPDIDVALDFYRNALGFEVYLEHSGPSQAAGPNVLGLPHNLATEIPRHVTIVHPTGANIGSVELLEFDGLDGADFSARAVPPNLGILMLRFEVSDLGSLAARLYDSGIEIAMPPTSVRVDPYGDVQLFAVRGPGGAWIEFYAKSGADTP